MATVATVNGSAVTHLNDHYAGEQPVDDEFIRKAIASSNLNALRLALFQVTGDPNVPHSQLTFRVHFTRPINAHGERIPHPESELNFQIPADHVVDVNVAACPPLVVRGRFEAEGQVARVKFRDPRWVPLQVSRNPQLAHQSSGRV